MFRANGSILGIVGNNAFLRINHLIFSKKTINNAKAKIDIIELEMREDKP